MCLRSLVVILIISLILLGGCGAANSGAPGELPTLAILPSPTPTNIPATRDAPPTLVPTNTLSPIPPTPTTPPPPFGCPEIAEQALDAAGQTCANMGRNEMCYGHLLINSVLNDESLAFVSAGDRVPVSQVQRLTLSPMNLDTRQWGVALARVQADLPGTAPGQAVTMIMFGNTEVNNVDGTLQRFTFRSGIGALACEEAPDGLLIQTPKGSQKVAFNINGVDVALGSTAFLTAEEDVVMTVAVLEGEANVKAQEVEQTAVGGEVVTIRMSRDLQPISPPRSPQRFTAEDTVVKIPVYNVANEVLPTEVPLYATVPANTPTPSRTPSPTITAQATSSDGGSFAGNPTSLQPGRYTLQFNAPTQNTCPAEVADVLTDALTQPQVFIIDNASDLVQITGEDAGIDNPEPDVYVATIPIQGGLGNTSYLFEVVSPTRVDIVMNLEFTTLSCNIIIEGTVAQ